MTGKLDAERVIALAGPLVREPHQLRTLSGASMTDLVAHAIDVSVPNRVISGSIPSRRAGEGPSAYLRRYRLQITVIEEDHKQTPMGWIRPMPGKYAFQPVLGSTFSKKL